MKKNNALIVTMCFGLWIQQMQGMEQEVSPAEKLWLRSRDRLAQIVEWNKRVPELKADAARYSDKSSFIQTDLPEEIEERINAIIDQKYKDIEGKSFEIFPTPLSKIFVLQNIEDFFEFQQDDAFKILNVIKKINELEKQLNTMDKTTDAYKEMTDFDDARKWYMENFGISTFTLKNMSFTQLDETIKSVKAVMDQRIEQAINWEKIPIATDADFRALWSIFVHLSYKQSQKQPMFVSEELTGIPQKVQQELEAKEEIRKQFVGKDI